MTPAYNQAEYLAETIESVLAQDYPTIEYFVLDDGSTDATPAVLRRYDGKIRWERHNNMGQARTLNKGWAMCSGVIVGYLSSDDRLLPNAVSLLVETLHANPLASTAYCDFELIDRKGRIIRRVETEDFSYRRLVEDLVCQPGPGALFRRRIIEEAGAWNIKLQQIPDFEFWLRSSRFGPFVRVRQVLAQFRIHEGSASLRPTSRERSMEIVGTMTEYWSSQVGAAANRSISNAHLIASRSHAQSGRYWDALCQFGCAITRRPSVVVSIGAWRMLVTGLLRRPYYGLRQRLK